MMALGLHFETACRTTHPSKRLGSQVFKFALLFVLVPEIWSWMRRAVLMQGGYTSTQVIHRSLWMGMQQTERFMALARLVNLV
jgi:hypothetical protein